MGTRSYGPVAKKCNRSVSNREKFCSVHEIFTKGSVFLHEIHNLYSIFFNTRFDLTMLNSRASLRPKILMYFVILFVILLNIKIVK